MFGNYPNYLVLILKHFLKRVMYPLLLELLKEGILLVEACGLYMMTIHECGLHVGYGNERYLQLTEGAPYSTFIARECFSLRPQAIFVFGSKGPIYQSGPVLVIVSFIAQVIKN